MKYYSLAEVPLLVSAEMELHPLLSPCRALQFLLFQVAHWEPTHSIIQQMCLE